MVLCGSVKCQDKMHSWASLLYINTLHQLRSIRLLVPRFGSFAKFININSFAMRVKLEEGCCRIALPWTDTYLEHSKKSVGLLGKDNKNKALVKPATKQTIFAQQSQSLDWELALRRTAPGGEKLVYLLPWHVNRAAKCLRDTSFWSWPVLQVCLHRGIILHTLKLIATKLCPKNPFCVQCAKLCHA